MLTPDLKTRIETELDQNPVVLYMKGTPESPMCGFSSVVVQILNRLNVPFLGVNVLADPELREGIKEYTNWPTIPQLYIQGTFIGGCDIARQMYEDGSLAEAVKPVLSSDRIAQ